MRWQIQHPQVAVTGTIRGHFQWSPALMFAVDYSTNPFTYDAWRALESSGKVVYENGILKLNDMHARLEAGTISGDAEVTDQSKAVKLRWTASTLLRPMFQAITDGEMELKWNAADFSDASGKGTIQINSRQYGRAQSDVTIQNARARLQIRANAFDSALRADVTTGLDQTLSGTFQATNQQYGQARIDGLLGGTWKDPRVAGTVTATGITYNGFGPLNASAKANLKSRIVSIDDVQAQLKHSFIPRGSLRLNLDTQALSGDIPEIRVQAG
jgi:autotransporter translocation and assembly factor TamB